MYRLFYILIFILSITPFVFSRSLDKLVFHSAVVHNLFPQERVYLHFDNSSYYLGEELWFSCYVFSGVEERPTTLSKVLYVELVSPEGYVVETKKYKLDSHGRCHGNFTLSPLLLSGYYEIRSYTRYMLNWGKDGIFSRVFPIFDKVNGDNWEFKNMLDRRRGFQYRGEWVSSELPPVSLKFYPEGGHLVNGLSTQVAYELLGNDGLPLIDTIYIYKDKKLLLKSVPVHMGKGTFELTPELGSVYHAEVVMYHQRYKFSLPEIESSGVVLSVFEDSLHFTVRVHHNLPSSFQFGFGVLHRGELSHYYQYSSEETDRIFSLLKDSLREGVNRAILFVNDSIPLSERQFFVEHPTLLPGDLSSVKLTAHVNGVPLDNLSLHPHEKISLTLHREDGLPLDSSAFFSISVSDASSRSVTSYRHTMYSYLLLGSELKGYIPDAVQYFDIFNPKRHRDLDLLMQTNGWTSYDWSKLTENDITLFHPIEKGITLKGTFYKKEPNKHLGELNKYNLFPQKHLSTKFEICYRDSIISEYEFQTDENGSFQIHTDDFFGKKIGALTPSISGDQLQDSIYSFSLDRYYSPGFRLYDYWERHLGSSLSFTSDSIMSLMNIRMRPFEYMLSSVDVTAAKDHERYSRPPHSEMRFDYLDEWEYAQDVTFLRQIKDAEIFEEGMDNYIADEFDLDLALSVFGSNVNNNIQSVRLRSTTNFIKYINNKRFYNFADLTKEAPLLNGEDGWVKKWNRERQNLFNLLPPNQLRLFANTYTASDVVKSAMYRHGYYWAYWTQLMVVAGDYSQDSIPRPDSEYLKGKKPQNMANFKEFVIRSDIGTRKQFKNLLGEWTQKGYALDNKLHYAKFYIGFLSQMAFSNRRGVDGYDREKYLEALYGRLGQSASYPYHPNYVACLIPYKDGDERSGIVPDLHIGGVKRYTSIQGYTSSKEFYSPDYSRFQLNEKVKDYRRTLFWSPCLKSVDGELLVEFYNNSVSKNLTIDVEGYSNGIIYGTNEELMSRTFTDEQGIISSKQIENSIVLKNPKLLAHCLKITNEGISLYKEKEYKRAFEKFYDAAALSNPVAMFYLGVCYSNGEGVERDSVKAFSMFRASANVGEKAAMHNLANCYLHGIGTEQNDSLAFKWYSLAANSGFVLSMTMLGKFYEHGLFTARDSINSLKWYSKAAENDEAYALYKIGCHQERLDSIFGLKKRSLKKSSVIDYITRSARLGNVYAQMKLSEFYRTGRYFRKSKKKRFEWLLHAANNGLLEAQELVAECFEKGRGTSENDIKAYHWYKRAGEQGSKLGKFKAKEYELFKFYK